MVTTPADSRSPQHGGRLKAAGATTVTTETVSDVALTLLADPMHQTG
jgi:hypothetical protein